MLFPALKFMLPAVFTATGVPYAVFAVKYCPLPVTVCALLTRGLFVIAEFLVLFCVVQFSQLLQLRQRLGKESFPLIDQSYFPSHKEMVSADITVFSIVKR